MSATEKPGIYLAALENGDLDDELGDLYGGEERAFQRQRYVRLIGAMQKQFAPSDVTVVIAPGRTELGGNHTDHNHGQVLTAAVHMDCVAAAAPLPGSQVVIHSSGFAEPICVDLSDLAPRQEEAGKPEAFVRGVAAGMSRAGYRLGGWTACVNSTVLPGAGLSSSAAFGNLLGGIFNALYNRTAIAALELARIAKLAENKYFGKPCGFMDQLASALGGVLHIDLKKPADPAVVQIDVNFDRAGYQLAVVDTGGSHAELTPEYAAITEEMRAVAKLFGQAVLRGLSREEIIQAVPRSWQEMGGRAFLRAIHFMEENQRVEAMVAALRRNQVAAYLNQVSASGDSSWRLLQNCYPTAAPKLQGIPLALTLSERFLNGKGASRGCVHSGTLRTGPNR
ncbi:MAG: galactokinase family protein [Desulfosarcinaceae bacterium]